MPFPEQSTLQRDEALAKANKVRLARAYLLRGLRSTGNRKTSLALLADYIERNEELIAKVPVSSLLRQCHRCGPSFAHKLLRELELTSTITVEMLSERRRNDIVNELRRLAR